MPPRNLTSRESPLASQVSSVSGPGPLTPRMNMVLCVEQPPARGLSVQTCSLRSILVIELDICFLRWGRVQVTWPALTHSVLLWHLALFHLIFIATLRWVALRFTGEALEGSLTLPGSCHPSDTAGSRGSKPVAFPSRLWFPQVSKFPHVTSTHWVPRD